MKHSVATKGLGNKHKLFKKREYFVSFEIFSSIKTFYLADFKLALGRRGFV